MATLCAGQAACRERQSLHLHPGQPADRSEWNGPQLERRLQRRPSEEGRCGARLRTVVNSTPTTYTQDLASPLPVVLQATTGSASTRYVFGTGTRPLAEYDSA